MKFSIISSLITFCETNIGASAETDYINLLLFAQKISKSIYRIQIVKKATAAGLLLSINFTYLLVGIHQVLFITYAFFNLSLANIIN